VGKLLFVVAVFVAGVLTGAHIAGENLQKTPAHIHTTAPDVAL
jgi:hypothetical protein